MAKYDVKFSCGHVETIQLYGKEADRAKKIAWFEEHGECSACYKARIAAAHAAETAAAAAKADEENLPALTGSEKQVNWALSIRAKKFADLDKMLADMTTTDEQLRRNNQIAIQATKNVLASKTESRFWIDNRNTPALKLVAVNNLQDELKTEFARLTAEAERNEVLSTPTVTTNAQDIAAAAEIELATVNNTADNITNDEHEQEATTMTITTTTNKAGKISGYYVDGEKTRKSEIDYIINSRRDEIIEVDYYVGAEFKALTCSPYRLKVVFTGMDRPIMTQAAADELGYKVIKVFTGSYNGTACIVEKETVVDEYATNNTTTAEVDADDDNNDDEPINIDDATYRTILLHAEKISNGQNRFAAVLKNELRNLLNVDASELIEAIKTDSNFLNRVRCYLADFPIIITNDEGTRYHLVKFTDDYCELDIINDEPKVIETIEWKPEHVSDEVYALIPNVDELNDVENFDDELNQPPIDTDKPVDDFGAKLAELQAKRDAAQAALLKAQEEHEAAENALKNFLTDTAADLTTKLQTIKFDYRIKLIKASCWTFSTTNFDDVYISAYRIGCGVEFHFETWIGKTLARYDTPARVDKVIDMLREAIKRGDTKFKFPTVDELNQPPMDTDLERKIKIEDSLRRAMEIATAEHERFLRLAATSYNKGTRSDCFREADNELKLYNICWKATNELWSERW